MSNASEEDEYHVPEVLGEHRGQVGQVAATTGDAERIRRAALQGELVVLQVGTVEEEAEDRADVEEHELHPVPGPVRGGTDEHGQTPGQKEPGDGTGVEAQAAQEGAERRVGKVVPIEHPEQHTLR